MLFYIIHLGQLLVLQLGYLVICVFLQNISISAVSYVECRVYMLSVMLKPVYTFMPLHHV